QLLTEDIEIEGGTIFTVKRGGQAVATAKLRAKSDQVVGNPAPRMPDVVPRAANPNPGLGKRIEAATLAAAGWLKLVDEGKYAESWEQSSELNRKATSQHDLVATYERLYKSQGKLTTRAHLKTESKSGPAGEFVEIKYAASFDHAPDRLESI